MFIKFIILFTIVIIGVKGDVDEDENESTTVESSLEQSKFEVDVARWVELHKRYLEETPYAPVRGSMKIRCRIVKECCADQRDHLFNILHEAKLKQTCISTRALELFTSYSAKCPSLIQNYKNIIKSTEYTEFIRIQTNTAISSRWGDWRSKMARVCSKAELTAYYCEPENMVPFKSCAEKVLRLIDSENGEGDYDKFVRHLKNDYDYFNKLSI